MSESRILAIKIDVDTFKGYLEGLPRMLDMLAKRNIKASIFFSMGPDNSGKAIRRIFRPGFISKMLRTKAPSTYGIKTMLYGTLLPAPMIVSSNPDILKRAIDEGHDCGIHAWDHVLWQDKLQSMSRRAIRDEFSKSMELFERISGIRPLSCAAPGWQVTPDSLAVQDELNFDYCSDVRGKVPFMPVMEGANFKTPQIATTLPTLDELWGENGLNETTVNDYYINLIEQGLNVHTVHTEMEGGAMSSVFERLLDLCLERGLSFVTLQDALKHATENGALPIEEIYPGHLPGRAGKLAIARSLARQTDVFRSQ